MQLFNPERSAYYKAKKRELTRQKEESRVVQEDALFIKYYGMSAYLVLFPDAKDFGIDWHRAVLRELQKLEKKRMGQQLAGQRMAYASTKSKPISRAFRRLIMDMVKR